MKLDKQKQILQYLISSPDAYALCSSVVKILYFDPELRSTIGFIQSYYEKYNAIPDVRQIKAETNVELQVENVTPDKFQYCIDEVESFCKKQAMAYAIVKGAEHLQDEDYGSIENLIREAALVSINKDLGVSLFYNPKEYLEKWSVEQILVSTGYPELDHHLGGGLARKQMLLFSANSGGGKSIAMANLGLNLAEQGLNGIYISLELPEEMITLRYASMLTSISSREWRAHKDEIATRIEMIKENNDVGDIDIKKFPPQTNSNTIRAYLKEYELKSGKKPDFLIVDYLDLMGTNEYVSADNVFEKDKRASEQLHAMGSDYNMIVITASQQNRTAVDQIDIKQSHIAGGISKVNTTDNYISVIFTEAMRAAGEIAFQLIKTRSSDGVGKTIHLAWDRAALRIKNPDKDSPIRMSLKSDKRLQHENRRNNYTIDNDDTLVETSNTGKGFMDFLDET